MSQHVPKHFSEGLRIYIIGVDRYKWHLDGASSFQIPPWSPHNPPMREYGRRLGVTIGPRYCREESTVQGFPIGAASLCCGMGSVAALGPCRMTPPLPLKNIKIKSITGRRRISMQWYYMLCILTPIALRLALHHPASADTCEG